ncbi:iron ABC transporter substrate-binding protein [Pseudooceanicola sediminis]|uniref:Iron ABC transporter substrate-binding protein n=1 Tax=Pseudooceanicola sediminis TaxID=2211117 RepID=A0A399JDE2_9RHOB|nr:Fe(3+) ABC transporter substrate-binding protein [Pseudooceanicola sediminis]KAA2316900.1 Fe(3+) ABC transporter substrate-binding protein [Puniceibacterium sp. HSS470]RII40646.1 iron ABC transporter substrate-binding protein [Pseudooceanicola sediminis]|tara:strand:+ start:98456 stop:99469 length:1014 start_codon:yes stop_codon:yes gene_type:complete
MPATRFTPLLLAPLALGAAPVLADDVNLYSYRQPELIAPLVEAFTKETGIDVNVAFLDQGMVERLKAEGARSPADLVLTVDIARLSAIVEAGVTQPIESTVLREKVPEAFHDPKGHWWGLTTRARIVYASKERVADGEVTTYEDLANPKWQGRICTRSGTHPYNIALTAAYLYHHDEAETKDWLTALKSNLARKPQGNDRAQVKAIWAGECDIAIGNTYYLGEMLADPTEREWAETVRPIFPTFKDGGAHVNISGIAMTKAAPHKENALKFVEFLVSPEAQQIYASANYEYPIVPGVEPAPLVKSWGDFTPDDVNLIDLAKLRPDALRLMEEVDFDG